MRRTCRSLSGRSGEDLLVALERHRDITFRRIPSRRIAGERSALKFIDEVGFCAAFTAGLGVPCLREAIAGEREPPLPEHIQHDYAIGMTWRIKDALPAKRLAYYGKVIGGRPGFISLDLLPSFLRLRLKPGGYVAMYKRGELSQTAKLVMDALSKRGPAETRTLKLSSGYTQPSRRAAFDRAMKELQEKFFVLKVEERYDPFTYVWDTVERRWRDAIGRAKELSPSEAAHCLVRRYFEVTGYGNERAIARLLGMEPAAVQRASIRLEREGLIRRGLRLESLIGAHTVLARLARVDDEAMRQSVEDVVNRRTRPARKVLSELRRRHGIPR